VKPPGPEGWYYKMWRTRAQKRLRVLGERGPGRWSSIRQPGTPEDARWIRQHYSLNKNREDVS